MIVTETSLAIAVDQFIAGEGRQNGERLGRYLCRKLGLCDTLIERQQYDGKAIDLVVSRWIKFQGYRSVG